MNKKNWTNTEVETLITEYETLPVLWDVTSSDYHNRVERRSALFALSQKFQTHTDEISRKLHNIQNQFNAEFKKMKSKKSGQGTSENYNVRWPHFNSLRFLEKSLTAKSTIGNLDTESAVSDFIPSQICTSGDQALPNKETPKSKEKITKKKDDTSNIANNAKLLENASKTLQQEDDVFDIFGSYVASEIRSLQVDQLRRKLKRKIQEAILEVSKEEDEMFSSPCALYTSPSTSDWQNSPILVTSVNLVSQHDEFENADCTATNESEITQN